MPAAVGAAEHCAVGLSGIDPPDGETQRLTEAACEAALAAARFADEQQRTQPDHGPADQIGEGKVDDRGGMRELSDQRAPDLIERRGLDQGKGDVEDILDGFDDALELCASDLDLIEPSDHDMAGRERCSGRRRR